MARSTNLSRAGGLWPALSALAMSASCVAGPSTPEVDVGGKADGPSHHIGGQPTNGADVFQWVEVGDDALETYRDTIFPPPRRGRVLAPDHETTLRYQAFVDQIDSYVRREHPELTSNTPRPSVRIYEDELINAWASGVPVCIDAPVTFENPSASADAEPHFSVILHHSFVEPLDERTPGGGFFGEPPRELEPCVEAPYSDRAADFVRWINERNGPCQYELRDGGTVHVSGQGCRIEGASSSEFVGALSARYHAVIPYIFLTTAFIDYIADEPQTVSVIAHELAHYYKSHATNADFTLEGDIFEGSGEADYSYAGQGYNFFYTQTLEPQPVRPQPRSDSDDIRQEVLRFRHNQDNPWKGVDGASLDPTLGRFVVNMLYGGDLPETGSCAQAREIMMDHQFYNLVYEGQLPPEAKAAYLELEAAFLDCAATIDVPGDVALEDVLSDLTPVIRSELPDFAMEGSLAEIVAELDRLMRVYSEHERAFYSFMAREQIGFYTAEQEADELGAELLAAIGIDPLSHALLDLRGGERREAEAPEAFARVNGLTMARCRELYDNGWVDPVSGEYVFIPIGSLTDTHHGACYRAFNTSREVLAHGYVAEEPEPPVEGLSMDEQGTVAADEEHRFATSQLPAGRYTFTMTGDGDADLYVRIGQEPTTSAYDCRPYSSGSQETCTMTVAGDDVIHVMIRGYAASSSYHLVGQ